MSRDYRRVKEQLAYNWSKGHSKQDILNWALGYSANRYCSLKVVKAEPFSVKKKEVKQGRSSRVFRIADRF